MEENRIDRRGHEGVPKKRDESCEWVNEAKKKKKKKMLRELNPLSGGEGSSQGRGQRFSRLNRNNVLVHIESRGKR